VLDERVGTLPGVTVYTRLARFERYAGPVTVQWALGDEGAIVGFLVQGLPTSEPAPCRAGAVRTTRHRGHGTIGGCAR